MEKEIKSDGIIKLIIKSDNQDIKITYDESKRTISVETSGGNQIILSDKEKSITLKDQNQNELIMDKNGITIDSVRDINLKARANLKLQGTASAELSASGHTVVKGAMVSIN